jgi:hypothetical protein
VAVQAQDACGLPVALARRARGLPVWPLSASAIFFSGLSTPPPSSNYIRPMLYCSHWPHCHHTTAAYPVA